MTWIQKYRDEYKDKPDSEVLALKHQFPNPQHEAHIAASQLLYERQAERQAKAEAESKAHHDESLAQARRLHGRTLTVAILAVVVSAIGVLAGIWFHFRPTGGAQSSTSSPTSPTPPSQAAKP